MEEININDFINAINNIPLVEWKDYNFFLIARFYINKGIDSIGIKIHKGFLFRTRLEVTGIDNVEIEIPITRKQKTILKDIVKRHKLYNSTLFPKKEIEIIIKKFSQEK